MFEDGYRIDEPTEYEPACEYRRELEPSTIAAERDEQRRRFVRAIEAAERRTACRQALAAKRGQRCDVEGCSGDLENPDTCCDACLLAFYLEARSAAAMPMQSPWHTADGRYFANQADAQLQQRWLVEKRQRHADRIAAYARRRGVSTDAAERDFMSQRFDITDAGRAALAEAEDSDRNAERALANTARIFDAITESCFPGLPITPTATPTGAAQHGRQK